MTNEAATFVARESCVACGGESVEVLDSGKYSEDPVRGHIESDPWGESPLPYLQDHVWEYVKCKGCGQMYQKWLLTPEWQEVRFSKWMNEEAIRKFEVDHGLDRPEVHFHKCTNFVKHVLRVEKLTRSIRGEHAVRVMDFGCGWGEYLVVAKQFGFDAYGVDRAPDRQEVTSRKGVTVFSDLEEAKQKVGEGFHAVSLFQVLEHIEEPLGLLKGIREVMTNDGVLILEVPNCEGVTGINSKQDYYQIHPLEHINCFTPDSLAGIARRAGFERIATPTAHVTSEFKRAVKGEVRGVLNRFRATTDQYFRCV